MKIALYPRVSTHEQAIHGHSIEEQIDRMKKFCEAMGWTVYKVYTDAGHSGANMDRPGLKMMIKDIEAKRVDKVLVYKLDRLSRSQKDTLTLIEDVFLANDCDFVSMTENLDTSTPFGKAMIGILAVFAQLEREQIKERMSMGRLARAKKGKYHGSDVVPVGYDYEDGELVIHEFEAMQVKKIFEMYLQGMGSHSIAKHLNESGLHPRNKIWSDTTIRALLSRKTYTGYVGFAGEWFKGTHAPLISEEDFEKVQELRKQRSKAHYTHNRRIGKATSYLGGYIYCKHCEAKYSKSTSKCKLKDGTIKVYTYYYCNSQLKKSGHLVRDLECRNPFRRMNELDNEVFEEIKKLALDPEYFDKAKREKEVDERPDILKKEIEGISNQLNRLMDLYSIGQLPIDVLQDKVNSLNEQKKKLELELDLIIEEQNESLSRSETMKLARSFQDILESGDYDQIRTVIGSLIEKIVIDGNTTTIYWTFA